MRVLLAPMLAVTVGAAAPQSSQPPARPVDPIGAIAGAFATHAIVAIGDPHGGVEAHAFLLSLIRDARFAPAANDIVVEIGNARYQQVADRFVRGDDVPPSELRLIWRNSTQPSVSADSPQHEIFFRAVRAVNASLPRDRQLRVLLGDPPIDWDAIRTREDHFKWIEMRDAYPAALVQIEVLAKRRRALVVYGQGHLQRRNTLTNFEMDAWQAQTLVSLVERSGPTRAFTIWSVPDLAALQPDVASWKTPSLAELRGTSLGAADAGRFFPRPGRFAVRDGKPTPVPREQWKTLPAEEQLDAVLYLGPDSAMTQASPSTELCSEPGYVEMRLKRIALAGLPPPEVDRVKQLCAGTPPK